MSYHKKNGKNRKKDRCAPIKNGIELKHDVWRFEGNEHSKFVYVLPSDTLKGRSVTVDSYEAAKSTGVWALRMMATKGAAKLLFGSAPQEGGGNRDFVAVTFHSDHAVNATRAAVEGAIHDFARNIQPNGQPKHAKLSLVAPEAVFTRDDFMALAQKFAAQHPKEPHVAGIKAILSMFNDGVAGPDGGEVVYEGYKIEGNEGIVDVSLRDNCSGCGLSEVTIQGRLSPLLRDFMPNAVQKMRIVKPRVS